ncbi:MULTISPECIES: FGGY-family carbohydrate kinase [Providencia]|uniref:FGGY-family carbohydrate kinase n=1 Tax=Providencia TaxID=586 RepID=UPI00029BBC5E|nr:MULTISPECIES: FGGY-family carbohydrate kinase [Providencia]EKT66338.1 Ribitol kinase [Providencia alcalifaciens Dmel2]EUD03865.1 FGGY-family pentulose kinase [Providencia alcalifaciens RIMD 1656011]EUD08383.1 FGGY-family pentulose kinase [Providencia alcalifaciens R90-1475]MTC32476.1 ribulokinase [Providencia alcalifaciens]QLQ98824.1 FGGY-family carbohydrate kinase [Providencia alcalifaciens]
MNSPTQNKNDDVVIGIDVGTGSARAGIFDMCGNMLASAKHDITLYRDSANFAEQSSNEIWMAVCYCVKQAMAEAKMDARRVAGIGFDATCSLVVLDKNQQPISVSPSEDPERNIIVWMDHRATEQAERINSLQHPVLNYVGGKISPEMETPKILWLKENRPQTYDDAWQFFDLADFLTWKSTGSLARSTCTVTCKWTYLAHEQRWDADYFRQIGLTELADENFARIGQDIVEPGTPNGHGLTAQAAEEMGLLIGTPVAAGMIDAHAGGIGTVGVNGDATANMAYVFGTSSCTMTTTQEPVFIPGVWGPYYSAMVPGMWLNEGGQSAAGAAIDQLLSLHPMAAQAKAMAKEQGKPLPVMLADKVLEKSNSPSQAVELAEGIHIVPEFLGNRAPFADPHAKAIIAGLTMDNSFDNLLAFYTAGVCSIGYGLRQIIEAQAQSGAKIQNIAISGGAGQHPLIRQLLADACGVPVISTQASEPVLLGSAILGAVAGGVCENVAQAMAQFANIDLTYQANKQFKLHHETRFASFKHLQQCARELKG